MGAGARATCRFRVSVFPATGFAGALENVMLPVELRDTMAQSQARELLEKVGLADRLTITRANSVAASSNELLLLVPLPQTQRCYLPTSRWNLDTQTGEPIVSCCLI